MRRGKKKKNQQRLKYIYLTAGKEQGKVMLKIQWFILGNSALLMHQTGEEEETITGTTALGLLRHTKLCRGQRASTKSKPSLFTFTIRETTSQPWEDKQTQSFLKECLKWIKPGGIGSWGKRFSYIRSVSNLIVLHRHLNILQASKRVEEA